MYYKVKCPKCKAINKDVNLDETEGWFECAECGVSTLIKEHLEGSPFPSYLKTKDEIQALMKAHEF